MENTEANTALRAILDNYGVPDPKIVGKLPRGGTQLDFVGHADITKILIEIDPMWWWEPAGWDNGRPAIHVVNGMAVMWGHLYVHGKQMLGVGTVKHDKADLDKELVGDFLRNAAMRFGICLSLWTKQEWESQDAPARPSAPKTAPAPANSALSKEQLDQFFMACAKSAIQPLTVAKNAGVDLDNATVEDLAKLREAFNELKAFKEGA
jgi:hypothetical protein